MSAPTTSPSKPRRGRVEARVQNRRTGHGRSSGDQTGNEGFDSPPPPPELTLTPINNMDLATAALVYIGIGWPVLPLKPRDKRPLTPHGLLDATLTVEIVMAWWTRWPEANIGLRTGDAFDVLDIDGPEGRDSLRQLAPGYQHPGPVTSTGKGHHLLFSPTGAQNAAKARDGLDFRGFHGYIVAPPSIHPNGSSYEWFRNGVLGPAPTWLTEVIFPPPPVRARPTDEALAESLSRTDIVSTFVDSLHAVLRPIGQRFITNCPFHDDSTPSCVLYPETNSFFCFGCKAWGDPINVMNFLRTGELH